MLKNLYFFKIEFAGLKRIISLLTYAIYYMSHSSALPVQNADLIVPQNSVQVKPDMGTLLTLLSKMHDNAIAIKSILNSYGSFINDIVNPETETNLLLWAIKKYYPMIVAELLKTSINVNHTDINGNNAVIYAVFEKLDIIDSLIKSGIDVNHVNKDKETALLIAIRRNHAPSAEKLIDNKADPMIRNKDNICAIDLIDNIEVYDHDGMGRKPEKEKSIKKRAVLIQKWLTVSGQLKENQ